MPFEVQYSEVAVEQLKAFRAFDRTAILDDIEQHLTVNPILASKAKIKLLRQPAPTRYRLRVGKFRVFYDVDVDSNAVSVIQILSKQDALDFLEISS